MSRPGPEGQSADRGGCAQKDAIVILFPATCLQAARRLAEIREDFTGWNMMRRTQRRRGRQVEDLVEMLVLLRDQYHETKRLRAAALAASVASARPTTAQHHRVTT